MAQEVFVPTQPRVIPLTEEDGSLDERFMPQRLSSEELEPPVDLVLLFENKLA